MLFIELGMTNTAHNFKIISRYLRDTKNWQSILGKKANTFGGGQNMSGNNLNFSFQTQLHRE